MDNRLSAIQRTKPNILFIPPLSSPLFTDDVEEFHPLGLMALCATLRDASIKADIYRPTRPLFTSADFFAVANEIAAIDADIIGFSTWCHSYPTSLLLATELKKLKVDSAILFGGPQATILHKETLENFKCVDFVLCGEADLSIIDFFYAFTGQADYKNVPGLTYRISGQIGYGKDPMFIENLDNLPIPSYDLYPFERKTISLDIGRGCPHKCSFCTTNQFFSRRYRVKSVDRVLMEIDYIRHHHGKTKYDFTHDMLTANRSYIIELCERLKSYRKSVCPEMEWSCSARIDRVDSEIIHSMADAGCSGIFFGIETGSQRMQKIIRKNLNINSAKDIITFCKRNRIRSTTSFIAGFPEEEKEDIDATLRCALDLSVEGAKVQVSLLSLMPQTELFEGNKNKLLLDNHFSDFSGSAFGKQEIELIKSHPFIFSSFYHLPIKSAKRNTLIFLNRGINLIDFFKGTVTHIWTRLRNQIPEGTLFELLEASISCSTPTSNSPVDLDWIIRLGMHLFKTKPHKEITTDHPSWDIFVAEAAGALVCRRFISNRLALQVSSAEIVLTPLKKEFEHSKIWITPWWTIFESRWRIDREMPADTSELTSQTHWYLCVAQDERLSILYYLDNEQLAILKQIEAIRKGKVLQLSEDASINILIKILIKISVLKTSSYDNEFV